MNIQIKLLKDCVFTIPYLIEIFFKTLIKWFPDISATEIRSWFEEWINDSIPLAIVAVRDDNISVGMCSLQMNDGIRQDLFPWLGDLCVDPQYQKNGIGKLLIEATKNKAHELGFDRLYLFTPDKSLIKYYTNLGWRVICEDKYHDHIVTIMKTDLL